MRKRAIWLAFCLGIIGWFSGGAQAQHGVTAVVVNEFANVRIVPAIGAEVLATVPAGYLFEVVTGRSPDNEWIRVDFNGDEGWVNLAPLRVLSGDLGALPVADPRSIPYGGFESPRAGLTNASSPISGRLAISGLRVRAGPSTGYPVLADAPRYTVLPLLGRTASNRWIQVNFEGTLGWVTASFIEFGPDFSITSLPIDGIVADELPISQPVADAFLDTLYLMRARVDLAQPSLDAIRASWTDAALSGRAHCRPYPARPSNYNIPRPLLAAYFVRLDPLQTLFNDAMFNVRQAIDLYIEVCNQPGTANPVGQATVIGALEIVALADQQFADLRRRLDELIPPPPELGVDQCLFSYAGEVDILPLVTLNNLVVDRLTTRHTARGYCFDAVEGQSLRVELIARPGGIVPLVVVTPFDNPTAFLGVGRGAEDMPSVRLGPIPIQRTGRYLLLVSTPELVQVPPQQAEYGFIILDQAAAVPGDALVLNPETGAFEFIEPAPVVPPIVIPPLFPTTPPSSPGQQPVSVVCPSLAFTCEQLSSCQEAYACLQAGNFTLDPENNGIPCQQTLCAGQAP